MPAATKGRLRDWCSWARDRKEDSRDRWGSRVAVIGARSSYNGIDYGKTRVKAGRPIKRDADGLVLGWWRLEEVVGF